ncbi:fungal-specific transcription factor domain-containing protein [Aspergillus insuetus]
MSNPGKADSTVRLSCHRPDRVRRACDRCNTSRTRCSGETPCGRCAKLNYPCQYQRTAKKRGPKPKSGRQTSARAPQCDDSGHRAFSSRESTSSGDSAEIGVPFTILATPDSDVERWLGHKVELPSPISTGPDFYSSFSDLRAFTTCSQIPFEDRSSSDCSGILNYGRFPIDLTPLATTCIGDGEATCRYPCLKPILPLLKGTLTPQDACDLLDVFFVSDDMTGTMTSCPYVLSPVIRRKSLLRRSNPRSTSPALLAVILWCVSHTADIEAFQDTTARSRASQRLYFLSMQLLKVRDADNWHRVAGGWVLDDDVSRNSTSDVRDFPCAYTEKPEPNVDDVISFVLLACVISRSDFREECLKWWNKAVLLVIKLGFNSEARIAEHTPSSHQMLLAVREEHEERRRAFWLTYTLDRHLALCFNEPLRIHDSDCQVLNPLPEWVWQNLDIIPIEGLPPRVCGPSTQISGTGFFEYFLPLMVILGDIIELRSRVQHPRFGSFDEPQIISSIEAALANCEYNLEILRLVQESPDCLIHSKTLFSSPISPPPFDDLSDTPQPAFPNKDRIELVIAYCQYMIRVLHILLYGKCDPVSLLDDNSGWLASPEFFACTSNAMAAGEIVGRILDMDNDLSFMPYLFGPYLFHGNLTFLVLADRMVQTGQNPSVEETCEVVIQAQEVSAMTFDTAFQKSFSRALRSTVRSARDQRLAESESRVLTRKVLSTYRWTKGSRGLL